MENMNQQVAKTNNPERKEVTEMQEIRLEYSDTPNDEMSLSVHKNGTTFVNFHNIENLKITKRKLDNKKVTRIEFHAGGKWVHIALFSQEKNKQKEVAK